MDLTALQHLCSPQTYSFIATLTGQRLRQKQTQQQTGSSLQDQMLRLLGFLHWGDWQKPYNNNNNNNILLFYDNKPYMRLTKTSH